MKTSPEQVASGRGPPQDSVRPTGWGAVTPLPRGLGQREGGGGLRGTRGPVCWSAPVGSLPLEFQTDLPRPRSRDAEWPAGRPGPAGPEDALRPSSSPPALEDTGAPRGADPRELPAFHPGGPDVSVRANETREGPVSCSPPGRAEAGARGADAAHMAMKRGRGASAMGSSKVPPLHAHQPSISCGTGLTSHRLCLTSRAHSPSLPPPERLPTPRPALAQGRLRALTVGPGAPGLLGVAGSHLHCGGWAGRHAFTR